MAATVNSEGQFTVALLSHLLSQGKILAKQKNPKVVILKKQNAPQVIENIRHVTVNLLSHAKSLKIKDATVKSPYKEIELLSQKRWMPCVSKLAARRHQSLPASRKRIAE